MLSQIHVKCAKINGFDKNFEVLRIQWLNIDTPNIYSIKSEYRESIQNYKHFSFIVWHFWHLSEFCKKGCLQSFMSKSALIQRRVD